MSKKNKNNNFPSFENKKLLFIYRKRRKIRKQRNRGKIIVKNNNIFVIFDNLLSLSDNNFVIIKQNVIINKKRRKKMSERKIEVRKYAIIDKETGEVVADDAMFIGRKAFVDTHFRKIFVGFLKDIVLDKDITGKAIRLLLWIIENLKSNDLTIMLYYKIVCEELEIGEKTFYRWLNILIDKKILEKTDVPNIYRLRPFIAVNGQMNKAIEKSFDNKLNNKTENEE